MRKWRNLGPSVAADSYYDVNGMWPTKRGTYETADFLTGTSSAATGATQPSYAFCAKTLTTRREFIVDANKIWELDPDGTYTERTNGVAVGPYPYMTQYGNVTICVMGAAVATVVSTSTTFSALAGAPKAEIALAQSNCLLLFNTDASPDGWAASDVGDYTNFTTGEAASGRLLATPGPITAAIPFGNDVIVFKANSIYRMTYVGGLVKWSSQLLWTGVGCVATSGATDSAKYYACSGSTALLFVGYYELSGSPTKTSYVYLFDGSSQPRITNPDTVVEEGRITYDPQADRFCLYSAITLNQVHFYCMASDMWGRNSSPLTNGPATYCPPVVGEFAARDEQSSMPCVYSFESANLLKRYQHGSPVGNNPGTCYLQTAMIGAPERKTLFDRVTPIVRRRRSLGTPSTSLSVPFYRELDGTAGIPTATASETTRQRFDFAGVDNFARPKVTWVNYDVEVDDIMVRTKPAGED